MNFTTAFLTQNVGQDGFSVLPLVTIGETTSETTETLNPSDAGIY